MSMAYIERVVFGRMKREREKQQGIELVTLDTWQLADKHRDRETDRHMTKREGNGTERQTDRRQE